MQKLLSKSRHTSRTRLQMGTTRRAESRPRASEFQREDCSFKRGSSRCCWRISEEAYGVRRAAMERRLVVDTVSFLHTLCAREMNRNCLPPCADSQLTSSVCSI